MICQKLVSTATKQTTTVIFYINVKEWTRLSIMTEHVIDIQPALEREIEERNCKEESPGVGS